MGKTLAFTGHRPQSLKYGLTAMSYEYARLQSLLYDEIVGRAAGGFDTFLCGAAWGCDIVFAEAVLSAKRDGLSNARLHLAIPYPEQSKGWPEEWTERYCAIVAECDEKVVLFPDYRLGCYHARNRYMVDRSQALLAVWNGETRGGTAYTVGYARNRGIEVKVIAP